MEKLLTIFTPTYNRAHLLPRLYESLKSQSCKNFKWMIIDDGSTDNTKSIVNKWIEECNSFDIEYYYKENGGLQTGYVEAIRHLNTELALCIDSDDQAVSNAVERIEQKWKDCKCDGIAGIYGYDCFEDSQIIGEPFDENLEFIDLIALDTGKMHRKVYDRALVIRSDLYKKTKPSKIYKGERSLNATVLHLQIALEYQFALLHAPLIQVEYQSDGMTTGMINQYFSSPKTCLDYRKNMLSIPNGSIRFYFRHAVHYVNSCIITKSSLFNNQVSHKALVALAIPFGIALNIYCRNRMK